MSALEPVDSYVVQPVADSARQSVFHHAPSHRLAAMLDADDLSHDWTSDELAAIYRHQVSTPLEVELAGLPAAKRLVMMEFLGSARSATILAVLRHVDAPVEALVLLKDYAKACRDHPASPVPRAIATSLYWLAVAAAHARRRQVISSLDSSAMAAGYRWTLDQPWVESPERSVLESALALVQGGA
jgi:hypothetical protein